MRMRFSETLSAVRSVRTRVAVARRTRSPGPHSDGVQRCHMSPPRRPCPQSAVRTCRAPAMNRTRHECPAWRTAAQRGHLQIVEAANPSQRGSRVVTRLCSRAEDGEGEARGRRHAVQLEARFSFNRQPSRQQHETTGRSAPNQPRTHACNQPRTDADQTFGLATIFRKFFWKKGIVKHFAFLEYSLEKRHSSGLPWMEKLLENYWKHSRPGDATGPHSCSAVVAGTWSGRFLADFDPAYPIQANFSEISARAGKFSIKF